MVNRLRRTRAIDTIPRYLYHRLRHPNSLTVTPETAINSPQRNQYRQRAMRICRLTGIYSKIYGHLPSMYAGFIIPKSARLVLHK